MQPHSVKRCIHLRRLPNIWISWELSCNQAASKVVFVLTALHSSKIRGKNPSSTPELKRMCAIYMLGELFHRTQRGSPAAGLWRGCGLLYFFNRLAWYSVFSLTTIYMFIWQCVCVCVCVCVCAWDKFAPQLGFAFFSSPATFSSIIFSGTFNRPLVAIGGGMWTDWASVNSLPLLAPSSAPSERKTAAAQDESARKNGARATWLVCLIEVPFCLYFLSEETGEKKRSQDSCLPLLRPVALSCGDLLIGFFKRLRPPRSKRKKPKSTRHYMHLPPNSHKR